MEQQQHQSELEQAGSLWKQISKKGNAYYQGYFGQGEDRKRIMLFANPNKRPDRQDPDAQLFFVVEPEKGTEAEPVELF